MSRDSDFTNETRANAGYAALRAWRDVNGEPEDEANVTDCIADILHWARRDRESDHEAFDADNELRRSLMNYLHEVEEEARKATL